MDNTAEFKSLFERYLAGATSVAEEQRLYSLAWELPADDKDVAMIRDIASHDSRFTGLDDSALSEFLQNLTDEETLPAEKPRSGIRRSLRRFAIPLTAAAAAVAAVILLSPDISDNRSRQLSQPSASRPMAKAEPADVHIPSPVAPSEATASEPPTVPKSSARNATPANRTQQKASSQTGLNAPRAETQTSADRLKALVEANAAETGTAEITDNREAEEIAIASMRLLADNLQLAHQNVALTNKSFETAIDKINNISNQL